MSDRHIYVPQVEALPFKREDLPQIAAVHIPGFLKRLESMGLMSWRLHVDPCHLKPTQKEFNLDKVRGMLDSDPHLMSKPSISSMDGYVLDGHHRWLADYNRRTAHPTIRVELPIAELIAQAHGYDKSFTKSISEQTSTAERHGWIDHEGKWRPVSAEKKHFGVYMDHLKDKHPEEYNKVRKLGGSDARQLNGIAIRHAKRNGWLHTYIDADGYGMIAGKKASFDKHRKVIEKLKGEYKNGGDVTQIRECVEP